MDDLVDPLPPSAFLADGQSGNPSSSMLNSSNTLNHTPFAITGTHEEPQSRLDLRDSQFRSLELRLSTLLAENSRLKRSNDEASKEVQFLRAYIGTNPTNMSSGNRTIDADLPQVEELRDKLDAQEQEIARLQRELDLSQSRAQSLETALELQEKYMASATASSPIDGPAKVEHLLKAWRTQVVRLLFQEENAKAKLEHAEKKVERRQSALSSHVESSRIEREALYMKLKASEASVCSMKERNELLRKSLQQKIDDYNSLQKRYSDLHRTAFCALCSIQTRLAALQESVHTGVRSSNLESRIMHRLCILERRLSFAANRLPVLRTHLVLRSHGSHKPVSQFTQTNSLQLSDQMNSFGPTELHTLLDHAKLEADRCRVERDAALRKLEEHVRTFKGRCPLSPDKVNEELRNLRASLDRSRKMLEEKDQSLIRCRTEFEKLEADHLQLQNASAAEREQLQVRLSETEKQLAGAKSELRRIQRRFSEQIDCKRDKIAELERNLKPQSPDSMNIDSKHDNFPRPNSKQLAEVTKSLHELVKLASCLRSDDDSDLESEQE